MTAQALPDATAPPATPPATPPAAPFIATPAAPPAAPPSHSAGATPISQLYRQLWHHAHGARGRMAAALAMLGSSQLLKLALPWLAAQAINSIQGHGLGGLPHAGWCIAGILALQVTSWALHGPARVLERNVAVRVRRSVADTLYGKLAQAPLAWHDQHHSGDLQHRVGQATGALYAFTQTQFVYLQNLINVVGPLLALTLLSPLTGAMAVVGMVLVGLAIVRFDGALMRLASQENDAERRYNARLLDFVGNMSAVVSLRLQAATRRLLDQRLLAVFKPLGRSIVLTEVKWCAVDLLTIALSWALVVAYALGSRHAGAGAAAGTELGAAAGTVMIGGLFMVYQYAQQAAGVLVSMAGNYQALARKQADFASADVIAAAPLPAPLPPALPADWNCIELHGLDYTHAASHGAASARGGVQAGTLQLRRGERIALVGPSGAGKSTLLRLLAGLYTAQAGRMTVDGRPQPGRLHLGDVATLIPQEADVFEASVRDNITLGDTVSDDALRAAVHTSALDAVLAQLPQGLDTPVSERGLNLSGGQRQRLALARGVLAVATHGSSLLLLDEPTSALDALTEAQVHLRLEETFGDACIVASVHRLGLLAHFDRVVFMQAGRIVDVGSVDELRQRQPVFAAMCAGVAGERAARPALAAPAARPAQAVG